MTPEKYMLEILDGLHVIQKELYAIKTFSVEIETMRLPETTVIEITIRTHEAKDNPYWLWISFYSFQTQEENRKRYKTLLEEVIKLKNNYEQGMERQPE